MKPVSFHCALPVLHLLPLVFLPVSHIPPEYIDKGQIKKGDTIVLLTDDASTIEEVEKHHATNYNWIYLQRKRRRGTEGGFNQHIISDEAMEVVSIMAEVKMASQCNRLVAGHSGFVTTITDGMDASGKGYKVLSVQTRVKKEDIQKDRNIDAKLRVEKMLEDIRVQKRQTMTMESLMHTANAYSTLTLARRGGL